LVWLEVFAIYRCLKAALELAVPRNGAAVQVLSMALLCARPSPLILN